MWRHIDGATWLVEPRPADVPAMASLSFRVGYLDETAAELGTTRLIAALVAAAVTAPAEEGREPEFILRAEAEGVCTHFGLVGTDDGVRDALRRIHLTLATPPWELLDAARDRARLSSHPWPASCGDHVQARWGMQGPGLSTLRPFAFDIADPSDVERFLGRHFVAGNFVGAVNEETLLPRDVVMPAVVDASLLVAPAPLVEALPRTLPVQGTELIDVTMVSPATAPGPVAMAVLMRRLSARLVEMEPLARNLSASGFDLRGGQAFHIARVSVAEGKAAEVSHALAQTLDDLAAMGVTAEECRWAVNGYVGELTAPWSLNNLVRMAERRLLGLPGDTCAELTSLVSSYDEEHLTATVRDMRDTALLDVVPGASEELPYPIYRVPSPEPVKGKRFQSRLTPHAFLRLSGTGVARTQTVSTRGGAFGWKEVPVASVSLGQVVLKVSEGDTETTFVDKYGRSCSVLYPAYFKADKLREVVGATAPSVPVVRLPPDRERDAELTAMLQRGSFLSRHHRLSTAISLMVLLSVFAGTQVVGRDAPAPTFAGTDLPAVQVLAVGQTGRFVDGSTVVVHQIATGSSAENKRVRIGPDDRATAVLLDVEECLSDPQPDVSRGYFDPAPARIHVIARDNTEASVQYATVRKPTYPTSPLVPGSCQRGWVALSLQPGQVAEFARYRSRAGDEARWSMGRAATPGA